MKNLPKRLATSGALKIRSELGLISGGKILDVATGSGDFIDILMKTLKDYDCFVGIDISRKDLESAEKRFTGKPVKLMEMNAESLKFNDNSFDTVSMAYSLHHLDRIDEVLIEMHRVLKLGGNFIIQEEFSDGKQTDAQKTNLLQHGWEAQIDSLLGETHKMTLAKHKIEEIISNLQLEPVEMFESMIPMACLFCKKRLKCIEDPKNQERVDAMIKEIDGSFKRLKEITNPEDRVRLEKIGKELKERNRKFGNAPPCALFVIGRKAFKSSESAIARI